MAGQTRPWRELRTQVAPKGVTTGLIVGDKRAITTAINEGRSHGVRSKKHASCSRPIRILIHTVDASRKAQKQKMEQLPRN